MVKLTFLLSIVWCFYGERIMQIDDTFKREIQKDSNYQKFLKQSLNWDSQNEDNDIFSVEVFIKKLICLKILKQQMVLCILDENTILRKWRRISTYVTSVEMIY